MGNIIVTTSPHIRVEDNTRSIMLDVVIALFPAVVMSVIFYSIKALIITIICVLSCVLFEYLYTKLVGKKNTISDFSAVVTGILLAFNLPPQVPFWIPIIGSFFAIVIVKQLFGGLGKNFVNPALAARAFLFSWPDLMTTFTNPFSDTVSSATPLVILKSGSGQLLDSSIMQLFLGERAGSLGETSALFLIIGGLYLLIRRVITLRIPLSFIGTVAVLTYIFPRGYESTYSMLTNILCGGLLLGAIFMATDYSTAPVTKKGQIIYGIGCGVLTVLFRYFGGYPEGVCFAILIMNCLSWLIDKVSKPHRYGTRGGGVDA